MLPVFVRRRSGSPEEASLAQAGAQLALVEDLASDAVGAPRIGADTEVALRREGPFRPFAEALGASGALREAFAEACALPEVGAYRRVRPWLFAGLIPLLMLAELDRELLAVHVEGAGTRLGCDLFLVAAVGADLARPLPRYPRTSAIVLAGAAARFALFVAKACARGVHPAIAIAAVLAIGAAAAIVWRAPTPARITRAILAQLARARVEHAPPSRAAPDDVTAAQPSSERALVDASTASRAASDPAGISHTANEAAHSARLANDPAEASRTVNDRAEASQTANDAAAAIATARPVSRALALTAAGAALGLPFMLAAAQRYGIAIWPRAVLYAAYAAFVPMAIERTLEGRARAAVRFAPAVALAAAAGFALSLGLTNGVHFGADAAAYAARCVSAAPANAAQRLLDAEAREVTRNLEQARLEWAFFAMNVLVVPLAEERVYRDFLQRILARRMSRAGAIASASTLFALAHLDVYRVAVYQMVPLGIACGVAFEEGGFIAAAVAHAMWNLHLLI